MADPNLPLLPNIVRQLGNMKLGELVRPSNMTCHVLGTVPTDSPLIHLLGLGLNYCVVSKPLATDSVDMERFNKDIRTKFEMAGRGQGHYNPKLYARSSWTPPKANERIETAAKRFADDVATLVRVKRRQSHRPNLLKWELKQLRSLRDHPDIMVTATDKNLGPALIDRKTYIDRALADHLLNKKNYKQLNQAEAFEIQEATFRDILKLTVENRKYFDKDSDIYKYFDRTLCRSRDKDGRVVIPAHLHLPHFYLRPKVHKTPWATRPVVSQSGSVPESLSKWLDYELQRVVHLCPCYLRDGWELLEKLKNLGPLPANTMLITADAVSMYSNIYTEHGLEVMKLWFERHAKSLPNDFHVEAILQGLKLIMTRNVFQFGDTYWIQLQGTAMGTSVACMYATIYFSFHEETKILPTDGTLLYRRFIDDAFCIQRQVEGFDNYDQLVKAMNEFGEEGKRLEWTSPLPAKQVDFLDLTLSIQSDGTIKSRTYQKPMNLHLHLPPSSAHSRGVFKSIIYGTLRRLRLQNDSEDDFTHFVTLFYERLCRRGHSGLALRRDFHLAARRLERSLSRGATRVTQQDRRTTDSQLFLHVKYHPDIPERKLMQQLFSHHLTEPFESEENEKGFTLGGTGLTIAYHRATNVRDLTSRTRLRQEPEKDVLVSSRINIVNQQH